MLSKYWLHSLSCLSVWAASEYLKSKHGQIDAVQPHPPNYPIKNVTLCINPECKILHTCPTAFSCSLIIQRKYRRRVVSETCLTYYCKTIEGITMMFTIERSVKISAVWAKVMASGKLPVCVKWCCR